MKLEDVLAPYKYFSQASESDNPGIIDFFKSITMDTGSFSLRYDRGENFFDFTKEQSDKSFVFIMKDEKGIVRGTAGIALIPHMINGKKEICAYLGDLRISPLLSAKIRVQWKKCYGEIIAQFSALEEFKGVRYLYSAILDDNQNAMRSLLKNNDQIIYHELCPYETINVFASNPFKRYKNAHYIIDSLPEKELRNFLSREAQSAGLHNYFLQDANQSSSDELTRRFHALKNLSPQTFLCVKDNNGAIVAVCAPWMCDTKKLIIEKMSFSQKILGSILPFLGIPKIYEKEAIKVLYLTHLTFKKELTSNEKREIICSIVYKLLKGKRNFHLISFFNFPQWDIKDFPFFAEVTKARFYQVMSKEQYENKEFLDLADNAPAFEIGLA